MTDSVTTTTAAVDLGREAATGALEIGLVAVVVALAAAYLWRTYFRRQRRGGGCAGCASAGACATRQPRTPAPGQPLS